MDGHGLILLNWLSHSVGQAMPTLLLIWSSYSMEPSFHPSRFLTKLAVNTITIADRAQFKALAQSGNANARSTRFFSSGPVNWVRSPITLRLRVFCAATLKMGLSTPSIWLLAIIASAL